MAEAWLIFRSFVSFMTVPSHLMLLIKIRIASSTPMDKMKSRDVAQARKSLEGLNHARESS